MDSQKNRKQRQGAQGLATASQEEFDFDAWAIAVRQQMIEALRKRGSR